MQEPVSPLAGAPSATAAPPEGPRLVSDDNGLLLHLPLGASADEALNAVRSLLRPHPEATRLRGQSLRVDFGECLPDAVAMRRLVVLLRMEYGVTVAGVRCSPAALQRFAEQVFQTRVRFSGGALEMSQFEGPMPSLDGLDPMIWAALAPAPEAPPVAVEAPVPAAVEVDRAGEPDAAVAEAPVVAVAQPVLTPSGPPVRRGRRARRRSGAPGATVASTATSTATSAATATATSTATSAAVEPLVAPCAAASAALSSSDELGPEASAAEAAVESAAAQTDCGEPAVEPQEASVEALVAAAGEGAAIDEAETGDDLQIDASDDAESDDCGAVDGGEIDDSDAVLAPTDASMPSPIAPNPPPIDPGPLYLLRAEATEASEPRRPGEQQPAWHREGDRRVLAVSRTLRSGAIVRFPGDVVVYGDVNAGAHIEAGGNIIVLGALRGLAHAGAQGDATAVVLGFDLKPAQLRIADHIAFPEGGGPARGGGLLGMFQRDRSSKGSFSPVVALVRDGDIVLEDYRGRLPG